MPTCDTMYMIPVACKPLMDKARFREEEGIGIQAIKVIWGRDASNFGH